MSQPDPTLRSIAQQIADAWDGEITGVVKTASGEVVMKWKWDREKRQPVKVEN